MKLITDEYIPAAPVNIIGNTMMTFDCKVQ